MEKSCMNCGTSGCDHKDARRCANGNSLWTPDGSVDSRKHDWVYNNDTGSIECTKCNDLMHYAKDPTYCAPKQRMSNTERIAALEAELAALKAQGEPVQHKPSAWSN